MVFFRGPLLLPDHYHIPFDIEGYHHPLTDFIAWSLRESGSLPWWNPFSYLGEPFFSNVQAAMFYPATLLTAVTGNLVWGGVPYWLTEVQLIAHVILAGLGAFVLARRLGMSPWPALAAATLYEFGGFMASQRQHLGAESAATWLPWLFAALHRLEEQRDGASAALAALPFAMMVLSGFPAAYLPALVFGPLLYGVLLFQRQGWRPWRQLVRPFALLALVFALGLMISAVSWLPGYQVAKRSAATQRHPAESVNGFSPAAATSFVWPNLFNQLSGDVWLPYEESTFLYLYQGVTALAIVMAAIVWLARLPRARPFFIAASVAFLWMFGKTFFVATLLFAIFPGFLKRGIYPQSVLAYFSLCFGILAGFVLDAYEKGQYPQLLGREMVLRLAAVTAIAGLLLHTFPLFTGVSGEPALHTAAAGGSLLISAFLFALFAMLQAVYEVPERRAPARMVAAVCMLFFIDLLTVGSDTVLNTSYGRRIDETPVIGFLRQRLGPLPQYRIDTTDLSGEWQTKLPEWRLPSANGMNPLLLLETQVYRNGFSSVAGRIFRLEKPGSPLLDLAGVRYIVTSRTELGDLPRIYQGEVNVFENVEALPRFFLAGGIVTAKGFAEAVHKVNIGEVDAARVVVVAETDAAKFPALAGPAASADLGRVEIAALQPNEVRLQVEAWRNAVLVASETYWRDWHASVDGVEQPLVRADGVLRAIYVPAGRHQVRMWIVPRMLRTAGIVSLAGVLLAACLLALPATRKQQTEIARAASP